jgi:hypothetical protein
MSPDILMGGGSFFHGSGFGLFFIEKEIRS